MPRHGALALLLAFAMSGCAWPDGTEAEDRLEGTHLPWTGTSSLPWVVNTTGCGFCSGNPDFGEVITLALYESGEVLWMHYGAGYDPNGTDVLVAPGLEPHREEIVELIEALDNGYVDNHTIKVHSLATSRLSGPEWERVRESMANHVADATDPGEPNYGCTDCSGNYVQLFGPRPLNVVLYPRYGWGPSGQSSVQYGNYEPGDAWGRIVEQLAMIGRWVDAWKEPATSDQSP